MRASHPRRALQPLGAKKGGGGAKTAAKPLPVCKPSPHLASENVVHCLALLDSYRRAVGKPLLPPGGTVAAAPDALFNAPFVVVSHGTEQQPIFNYGNAAALNLFGLSWEAFTALESRRSAAPDDAAVQADRAAALAAAASTGVTRDYAGVRVTASGRRFRIEGATLWRVALAAGRGEESEQRGGTLGAAATFGAVTWLDDGEPGAAGERWRFTSGGGMERDTVDEAAQPAVLPAATAVPSPLSPAVAEKEAAVAKAAVDALAGAVRSMKSGGAEADEVAEAVERLLAAKARLAAAEAAIVATAA